MAWDLEDEYQLTRGDWKRNESGSGRSSHGRREYERRKAE